MVDGKIIRDTLVNKTIVDAILSSVIFSSGIIIVVLQIILYVRDNNIFFIDPLFSSVVIALILLIAIAIEIIKLLSVKGSFGKNENLFIDKKLWMKLTLLFTSICLLVILPYLVFLSLSVVQTQNLIFDNQVAIGFASYDREGYIQIPLQNLTEKTITIFAVTAKSKSVFNSNGVADTIGISKSIIVLSPKLKNNVIFSVDHAYTVCSEIELGQKLCEITLHYSVDGKDAVEDLNLIATYRGI